MQHTLGERDRRVLGAIVEEFVHSAEPVGSRHLTRKYRFDFSPATVRNVMSDLEEMGYLVQPHTSAGRKPTDRAYRFYVDHLLAADPLPVAERRRIRRLIAGAENQDADALFDAVSRALSSAARQVGLVISPRFETNIFRRIDFVLLRKGRVLVLLVSQAGVVHHRPVEAPEIGSQDELDQMANYLNSLLRDLPLHAVKERILTEMATEKALYDSLFQRALALGQAIVDETPAQAELHLGDPTALFDQPEFATASQMRALFEAFEKKAFILRLLERASEARGVQILIGNENPVPDLQQCTIVSAPYGSPGASRGSLGVIGPTRMDYGRVIGLVDYVARVLGDVLAGL